MPMNFLHRRICNSDSWRASVAQWLPGFVARHDLGDHVLELGPGFGATTNVLVEHVPKLTALEIDEDSANTLARTFAGRATIVQGDGADMPFGDNEFTGVVCFTMLHHVPSRALQDKLFAETCRVLAPGGVFAGRDSRPSFRFRLIHIGDTMTIVDPETLPDRLARVGFTDIAVEHEPGSPLWFSARKP